MSTVSYRAESPFTVSSAEATPRSRSERATSGIELEVGSTKVPNVVLVHDYLTGRGGAERVALSLARGFDASQILSSLYEPEGTFEGFSDFTVASSALNRIKAFRSDHRRAFPLLPATFSRMSVDEADVVLCSSSGWAHGVRTLAPKIVYCHTPARWLHEPADYFIAQNKPIRRAIRVMSPFLQRWDRRAAKSVTRYLANSSVVAERIKRIYGIDAEVVHAPPGLTPGPSCPVPGIKPGFLLSVGRDRGYKNVGAVVAAMELLPGQRLVTVGGTAQAESTGNVRHLGVVSDEQLRWLYSSARAVVSAAYEDFGLSPLEGFSFGKPAVLLRAGGFLDTMREGVTGVFFEKAEPWAIAAAVHQLPAEPDTAAIVAHGATFSEEMFHSRIRAVIEDVLLEHAEALAGRAH